MTQGCTLRKGFTIGADPELFVTNAAGKIVCADGLLPGTKSEPYKVNKGAIQVDGMAAEFNIDPAATFEEFSENIDTVVAQLRSMLPAGYGFSDRASHIFDEDVFFSAPEQAKELGCSPDFNAWTGGMNTMPVPPHPAFRTVAGHIHVGWTSDADLSDVSHILSCQDLVKQFDMFLGGWSVEADKAPGSIDRRTLYGKSGACRYKPYGVEYRVLSNFWVLDAVARRRVWNRACLAIDAMAHSFYPDSMSRSTIERVRNMIDSGVNDPWVIKNYSLMSQAYAA